MPAGGPGGVGWAARAAGAGRHAWGLLARVVLPRVLLAPVLLWALPAAQAEPPGGPPAQGSPVAATRLGYTQLDAPGGPYDVEWQLPGADAAAAALSPPTWVLLQHGFGRSCANLRGTARRLAEQGLSTLCINADMAAGAPAVAQALASALLASGERGFPSPDGLPTAPVRWVLGGHSAGALFAARVGAALVAAEPERVAGALLLDPVGGGDLADALLTLSAGGRRPVRAVMAAPSGCNARHLALPALLRVQAAAAAAGGDARVGVHLQGRSTHLDAEGEDTELAAVWACREGRPDPAQTAALRDLAAAWARAMATSEGGWTAEPEAVQRLQDSGGARPIGRPAAPV